MTIASWPLAKFLRARDSQEKSQQEKLRTWSGSSISALPRTPHNQTLQTDEPVAVTVADFAAR